MAAPADDALPTSSMAAARLPELVDRSGQRSVSLERVAVDPPVAVNSEDGSAGRAATSSSTAIPTPRTTGLTFDPPVSSQVFDTRVAIARIRVDSGSLGSDDFDCDRKEFGNGVHFRAGERRDRGGQRLGATPVVFIHGLWLLPSSWANWADFFKEAGYAPLTPDWPDDPETVEEARANPDVLAKKTLKQVADHTADVIGALEKKPAVMGHSTGGLVLAQMLAGRGLSAATVAIDPGAFAVLPLPVPRSRPVGRSC